MDAPETNVITRRSTRSFVEDELDANLRELQDIAPAETAASSTDGQSPSDSAAANGRQNGSSVLRISVDAVITTNMSSGVASSSTSTLASSRSSILSMPSTGNADAVVADLLDGKLTENHSRASPSSYCGSISNIALESLRELEADDIPPVPPGAPVNFGFVMPGLYRSSYPKPENFDYLKTLGLQSVVTLVDKNYTEEYRDFIQDEGIQHYVFAMKGTKKENIPIATMEAILNLVLDRRNYPLLIHCNQGRHRTGCVVAVVRTIAGWDRATVTDEYRAYAGRKVRDCDINYINAFELSHLSKLLASDHLDIDELAVQSRIGGPMVGRPPPTTVGFRVPNFFRTTFFSMTVLIIWMVSGAKMPALAQTRGSLGSDTGS